MSSRWGFQTSDGAPFTRAERVLLCEISAWIERTEMLYGISFDDLRLEFDDSGLQPGHGQNTAYAESDRIVIDRRILDETDWHSSAAGRYIIAHELAHVAQKRLPPHSDPG